jgi:hypothetical protein
MIVGNDLHFEIVFAGAMHVSAGAIRCCISKARDIVVLIQHSRDHADDFCTGASASSHRGPLMASITRM